MQATPVSDRERRSEAGFTLVEALVAMVVLVVGLLAVANLMVVAGTSNSVANQSTATAAQATEVMERLRSIPFNTMTAGGDLVTDVGTANCDDDAAGVGCVVAGNFNAQRQVPGVGIIKTRWTITNTAGDAQLRFIRVRSEGLGSIGRARTRSEFTTFRSCTDPGLGCPCRNGTFVVAPATCPFP